MGGLFSGIAGGFGIVFAVVFQNVLECLHGVSIATVLNVIPGGSPVFA